MLNCRYRRTEITFIHFIAVDYEMSFKFIISADYLTFSLSNLLKVNLYEMKIIKLALPLYLFSGNTYFIFTLLCGSHIRDIN